MKNVLVEAAIVSASKVANKSTEALISEYEKNHDDELVEQVDSAVRNKYEMLKVNIYNTESSLKKYSQTLAKEELNNAEEIDFYKKKSIDIQDKFDTVIKDNTAKIFTFLNNKEYNEAVDLVIKTENEVNSLTKEVNGIKTYIDKLEILNNKNDKVLNNPTSINIDCENNDASQGAELPKNEEDTEKEVLVENEDEVVK